MLCKKVVLCSLVITASVFAAGQVLGSIVQYTSESDFNTAVASLGETPTFENFAGRVEWPNYTNINPYINGRLRISSIRPLMMYPDGLVYDDDYGASATVAVNGNAEAIGVNMTFPNASRPTFTGTALLSDATSETFSVDNTSPGSLYFLGYVSTTPGIGITSITFNGNTESAHLATVSYAGTVATPEPGTCVLVLTGLLGLLAYAWRRR